VKSDAGIRVRFAPGGGEARLVEPSLTRERARPPPRGTGAAAGIAGAVDAPREELFGWWRRWFEALASDSAFVVVFEDLQWADDVMLGFVEHLVDWAVGLPMLVVCAARPELYERHPAWGGGRRNSSSISLPPISRPETSMPWALPRGVVLPAWRSSSSSSAAECNCRTLPRSSSACSAIAAWWTRSDYPTRPARRLHAALRAAAHRSA
jgi:hypothetical protein